MRDDIMVQEIMNREFLGVSESDPLVDAAELLVRETADCLVVVRGGDPVGYLSARDALEAMLEVESMGNGLDNDGEPTVGEVMNGPAPTIAATDRVSLAEDRLITGGSSRLIVTADGEAVGILTERDVLTTHPAGTRSDPEPETDSARELDRSEDRTQEVEIPPDREEEIDVATEATQSICEVCGTLTAALSNSNGRLVCPDCQEF